MGESLRRLVRTILAFLALPGTVAILIPGFLLRPAGTAPRLIGVMVLATGLALLLWYVREFHVAGRGTLAPWSPPQRLVTAGLYRYSRNPMYLAVLVILAGWALAYQTALLWIYCIPIGLLFHLRVVLHEEPALARLHGDEWTRYRKSVPRWLGRTAGK